MSLDVYRVPLALCGGTDWGAEGDQGQQGRGCCESPVGNSMGQNQGGAREGADMCGFLICESRADRFADESGVGGEIKKEESRMTQRF